MSGSKKSTQRKNEQTAIKNNEVFQTTYDELTGLGKIIRQKQTDLEKKSARTPSEKIDKNDYLF